MYWKIIVFYGEINVVTKIRFESVILKCVCDMCASDGLCRNKLCNHSCGYDLRRIMPTLTKLHCNFIDGPGANIFLLHTLYINKRERCAAVTFTRA